jgi:hypothetical protein
MRVKTSSWETILSLSGEQATVLFDQAGRSPMRD